MLKISYICNYPIALIMKTISLLLLLAATMISYSGCEMIEKGSEDSSCGESASLAGDIFPGADNLVEQSFYGFVDDKITFVFHTPSWLEQEPICPYQPVKAEFTVTINSEYLAQMQGVSMQGMIYAGLKTFQIPLQANGNTFTGKDESVSLLTDDFDRSGVAYTKGEVIIRFPYSGNTATDIQKLRHALNRMIFIINIHRVKI